MEHVDLSFAQERLWFLDQLIPESALYNIPLAFCIKGSLNEGFLQQAFDKLIERHEILRTVIKTLDDGKAVQEIRPISKFSMSIVDLQLNEGSNKEEEIREYIQREAVTPFHLSEGPLLRGVLLKISKDETILLLTMHHIISDGWSLSVLAKEISALYNGYCQGQEIVLPELPIQYADFALWQREWLKEDVLEKQLSYWREQLKDAPDLLELPTDHARPKEPSYRGEIYSWRLSRTIADGIKKLGKEQGATLFMTLLAAFKVLLYRYSGQNDIVVGTPIANRHYPGVEGLIGFFANTIPLRTILIPQDTFTNFLKNEVRSIILESYKNQDIPFEQIVTSLKVNPSINKHPIFQVMFDFQLKESTFLELEKLEIGPLSSTAKIAKFDLLVAVEEGDEIYLEFEYAVDLFERSTIGRMAGHFEELLKGIISTPNSKICDLPLLSKDEQHQLLVAWNETTHDYPKDKQLQELFENQVEKTPDAIAVIYEGEELTYAELNERANQLGHYLREKGAGPEVIVGISLERSLELIIGLLGILKSGSAYVPLDPNYPEDRLNFMLEDSGSKILLTKASLREKFEGYKGELILIDEIKEELGRTSSENLARLGNSENLAYVIYTSGSTGTPKGVMIQHQSVVNCSCAIKSLLDIDHNDAFLAVTSISFDVAVLDYFLSLLTGGKCFIASSEAQKDPTMMKKLLDIFPISAMQATPTTWQMLIEAGWKGKSNFKIMSAGEALTSFLSASLIERGKLYNIYGPTESTIYTTFIELSLENLRSNIPIGRPIWNTQVYILDENKQPVSIGVAGELYIGGAGLARGYLNRPELTAERFIENPFSKELGSRLYRTGDKVRYLADGNIEYLGRLDEQVKIRGYRIELGEIGSVLSEHPLVQQAVVNVWEEEGQKRLVGYVVPRGKELEEDGVRHSLRTYLQSKLPDYMVPSSFVVMESLPLTASGKINRRALPPPNGEQGGQESYVAPRTELEKQLAELWSEILHVNPIGIHDNFFELGGNSLLAAQCITRINTFLNISCPVKNIFLNPTIFTLVQSVDSYLSSQLVNEKKNKEVVSIQNNLRERYEDFPLTDVQQAYWFGRSGLFELGNVAVQGYSEYDFEGLDIEKLEEAWNLLIKRHEALRIVFPGNGYQRILQEVPYYKIEINRIKSKDDTEINSKLNEIRSHLSHLILPADQWPLFSIKLTKYNNFYRLHLNFDSLIVDDYSLNILFNEWAILYFNSSIKLRKLELSFRDYVLAEHDLKKTKGYVEAKQYWISRIPNLPSAPQLPIKTVSLDTKNQSFSRISKKIPRARWDKIKAISLGYGINPSTILLTCFSEVISRWSANQHFMLNLTLFNRLPIHPQVNQIVGDFSSLLLLEIDNKIKNVNSSSTFTEKAKLIQDQLWQDIDNRLFSGIEVIREIKTQKKIGFTEAIMPVVFTCVLGNENDIANLADNLFQNEIYSITQTSQVWLDYKAYEVRGDLIIEWDYVNELFNDRMINAMHQACYDYVNYLGDKKNWSQEFTAFLSPEDLRTIKKNNDTGWVGNIPLLHHLFDRQAALNPNQMAIIEDNKSITYQELYTYSNQLSHLLYSLGANINERIALIIDKGWEQILGCLGSLKAGAAYIPVDPDLPLERINKLLVLGEPCCILVQAHNVNKLRRTAFVQSFPSEKIIILKEDFIKSLLSQQSSLPLCTTVDIDDNAYIIFTSGSTGEPKGVVISHKGAVNTILDINDKYNVNAQDSILAISNLNFDLSVYDIFGLLACGGTIIMPHKDKTKDPESWLHLIQKYRITLWNSVPILLQLLVEYIEENNINYEKVNSLRVILLSGDWIPVDLPSRIRKILYPSENLSLISLGGATEASIWSIYYPIKDVDLSWTSIPYGKPLRNQTFYVLNDNLEVCPLGVVGKLYIGGIGLAKEYWKDKEKTSKSFIVHPKTSERLYKTGDLGRYLTDGNIEFLGREDFQVKISGHRIELGEIESCISTYPGISKVIVTTYGDLRSKYLVAYIVPNNDRIKDKTDLKKLDFKISSIVNKKKKLQGKRVSLNKIFISSSKDYFARKSYREFKGGKLTTDILRNAITTNPFTTAFSSEESSSLSFDLLSKILSSFAAINEHEFGIPKYKYPSAGNIYPVKIYINIYENIISGIDKGSYYFDPIDFCLIREIDSHKQFISDTKSKKQHDITLSFIGNLKEIEQTYGNLSEDFCFLEAGYLKGLATLEMAKFKYGLIPIEHKSPAPYIIDESKELFIGEFGITSTVIGDLTYLSAVAEAMTILVYVKEQDSIRNNQRWYIYDNVTCDIVPLRTQVSINFNMEENFQIWQNCSFAIFFLANKKSQNDKLTKINNLLMAGYVSEILIKVALESQIGMCPIGMFNDDILSRIYNILNKDLTFIHGLFGGMISDSQKDAVEISGYQGSNELSIDNLKTFLGNVLPSYMVPKQFIILANLPLNANGKIDMQSLPSPNQIISNQSTAYIGPRNEVEFLLQKLWEEVFMIQNISIYSNFEDLGGNSLQLIRLLTKINNNFVKQVTINNIIQNSNIAKLSLFLGTKLKSKQDSIFPIHTSGNKPPLFLIHPGSGLSFPYSSLSYYLKDRPIYGIHNPRFGQEDNFKSIEDMAKTYVKFIQEINNEGPYYLGGWSFGGVVALEIAQLLTQQNKEVENILMLDSHNLSESDGIFLNEEEFVSYVHSILKRHGIDQNNRELNLIKMELENSIRLLRTYSPKTYDGRLFLLKATGNTNENSKNLSDLYNGWRRILSEESKIITIDLNHEELFDEEQIFLTAQKMKIALQG